MEVLPLDRTVLIALMAAGLAFALCGVWLMLRPKPEAGAAKVELFGMKFESSSAGLLVFLIGSAFLATPLIVPERQDRTRAADAAGAADVGSSGAATGGSQAVSGKRAVILPAAAGAEEEEPNNYLTEANQIERGVFYAGRTRPDRDDREDWYVLPTADAPGAEIDFQVRTRAVGGIPGFCHVTVIDDEEREMEQWKFTDVGTSSRRTVFVANSAFLLARVHGTGDWFCEYEIKAE